MLLHKEYYTIVLCYPGYWWQQTSRLLYVQSWKIHKKRSADHRRGKHFFLSFPTCLFTTLKRIRGAGGICQTDSQSHFNKFLRWEQNMGFGSLWQFTVYEFIIIYVTILSSISVWIDKRCKHKVVNNL